MKHYKALEGSFLFYPSNQEVFGKLARNAAKQSMSEERSQIKVFHFASNNEDGAESLEEGTADLTVNANELLRIFQRTGAEPNPDRTAQLSSFGIDRAETPYEELLADTAWSMDKEPRRLTVTVKRKKRVAYLCTNLGQADTLLAKVRDGNCDADIIRIIG